MSQVTDLKRLAKHLKSKDLVVAAEIELAAETIERHTQALEHLAHNDMLNVSETARVIAKNALRG